MPEHTSRPGKHSARAFHLGGREGTAVGPDTPIRRPRSSRPSLAELSVASVGESQERQQSPDGEALGCDPGMLKQDLGHREVALRLGLSRVGPAHYGALQGLARGSFEMSSLQTGARVPQGASSP